MSDHVADLIKNIQYWLRLAALLQGPLRDALLDVLHNTHKDPHYTGLPTDPTDLYDELKNTYGANIQRLFKKKVIKQSQYNLIFPLNDQKTYSSKFDITLIVVLISNCTDLAPPNFWKRPVSPSDNSTPALVVRARDWRNSLFHDVPFEVDENAFKQRWNEGVAIIIGLGSTFPHADLKKVSLDAKDQTTYLLLKNYVDANNERIERKIDESHEQLSNDMDDNFKLNQDDINQLKARIEEVLALQQKIAPMPVKDVQQDVEEELPAYQLKFEIEKANIEDCILSCNQVLDTKCPMMLFSKRDGDSEKVQHNECEFSVVKTTEHKTYVSIFSSVLETGYNYMFQLEAKDLSGEEATIVCNDLKPIRGAECHYASINSEDVILISHNDGKPCNVHFFKCQHEIKPDNECKPILKGASSCARTVSEFRELAREYQKYSNVMRFPPRYMINDPTVRHVGDALEKLLPRNVSNGKVVTGYDVAKHLQVFDVDDKVFYSMEVKNDRWTKILLLEPQRKVLMMSFIVDGIGDLKEAFKLCNNTMKAIYMLNKAVVENHFIALIGTIVLPDVDRSSLLVDDFPFLNGEDFQDLSKEGIFFLTKDEIESTENLKSWWNQNWQLICNFRKVREDPSKIDKKTTNTIFHDISSEVISTMALTDIYLPRMTRNAGEKVSSLLLNKEQLEVVFHEKQWRVITGPFGSGKSLILKTIAQHLYQEKCPAKIYYLCFDPYSLLEVEVSKHFDQLIQKMPNDSKAELVSVNIQDVARSAGLKVEDIFQLVGKPPKNLADLIDSCVGNSSDTKPIHFLVDEFPGHLVDKEYCDRLAKTLKEKMTNSTLVIALQSVERIREIRQDGETLIIQKSSLEDAGMTLLPVLRKSMRMCSNLFELVTIAQECVKESELPLDYGPPRISSSRNSSLKPTPKNGVLVPSLANNSNENGTRIRILAETQPMNVESEVSLVDSVPSEMSSSRNSSLKPTPQKDVLVPSLANNSNENGTRISPSYLGNQDMSLAGTQPMSVGSAVSSDTDINKLHDLQMLPKLYPHRFSKQTSKTLKTKFDFKRGNSGHDIEGHVKPQLLYLDADFTTDSARSGKILANVLERMCIDDTYKCTIICSTTKEVILTKYALDSLEMQYTEYVPYLCERYPSKNEKEFVLEKIKNKSSILLTDYRGFRGCESEHCITFVEQGTPYANIVLVEILTRAISKIDILVLPAMKENVTREAGSNGDVLGAWKKRPDLIEDKMVAVTKSVYESQEVINVTFQPSGESSEVVINASDQTDFNSVQQQIESGVGLNGEEAFRMLKDSTEQWVSKKSDGEELMLPLHTNRKRNMQHEAKNEPMDPEAKRMDYVKLFHYDSAVRGYHRYRNSWQPQIQQKLVCSHEKNNTYDPYAIKVVDSLGKIVGHLPRENAEATKKILDKGAQVFAIVTSTTCCKSQLAQGGLEILCRVEIHLPSTVKNKEIVQIYKSSVINEFGI